MGMGVGVDVGVGVGMGVGVGVGVGAPAANLHAHLRRDEAQATSNEEKADAFCAKRCRKPAYHRPVVVAMAKVGAGRSMQSDAGRSSTWASPALT